jgi:hypothetical protein
MKCCICGPVKNCAPFLDKVFENIEKIGSLFEEYQVMLFYDKSSDNSLQKILQYQMKNPQLFVYINPKPKFKYRTHNIAYARNYCLQYVRENKNKYDYFIMMDMDNPNAKNIHLDVLRRSLERTDWDGLSFNTSPYYYDIWALSLYPFCFSYNHFHNNYKYHTIIRDYVMEQLKRLKPGEYLGCISSFNGFSIYRTSKFMTSYYDGRVRSDLFSPLYINTHARAQNSYKGLVYKNYGHIDGLYEDCEHRSFHMMAQLREKAKIMINPEILFG